MLVKLEIVKAFGHRRPAADLRHESPLFCRAIFEARPAQEANNARRNQLKELCINSGDFARLLTIERLFRVSAALLAVLPFCSRSSSPRRRLRNAATAASSALIPATFSVKYLRVSSFRVESRVPSR